MTEKRYETAFINMMLVGLFVCLVKCSFHTIVPFYFNTCAIPIFTSQLSYVEGQQSSNFTRHLHWYDGWVHFLLFRVYHRKN